MVFYILLCLGLLVLSFALWSYPQPLMRKLGGMAFVAIPGVIIFALTQSWLLGVGLPLLWVFLIHPWLVIYLQVRHLRLPLQKTLRMKTPPSDEDLPALADLTQEIEGSGFEQVRDTGWDWDNFTQFFRLFYNPQYKTEARICVNQFEGRFFYYVSLVSSHKSGTTYMTTNDPWTTANDPFSYGMIAHPGWKLNRFVNARSFRDLHASHQKFLSDQGIKRDQVTEFNSEEMMEGIERDMTMQLSHNLRLGLLVKATDTEVRYSLKGMIFVWVQALRDMVRFT